MSKETFKATHLETREKSVHIEHLGKRAFLPRSQIERMDITGEHITLTIPTWLYKANFEDEKD